MALSLTSKTHPYKAGLGPFAPEIYRVPLPHDLDALASTRFKTRVAAEDVAAIVVEPVQGEGGFVVPPQRVPAGPAADLRRARHRPGRRRGADGLLPHRQDLRDRALRRRARPDGGRQVDRRRPAALGRARPGGDHGRARRQRDRRHVRRQPRRDRRRARRARRDRGRAPARARRARSARRSARGWRAGASASTRSATCAGSARCWPSSRSSRDGRARRRARQRPSSRQRPARGLLLLKAGIYGNCIRVLVPLVDRRTRSSTRRSTSGRRRSRSARLAPLPRQEHGGARRES